MAKRDYYEILGVDRTVSEGDLIMGGWNFGCGSSREQPVLGLRAVGIKAIVARSFARIFYRAAINQGLILIECPGAVDAYTPGAGIELDMDRGEIAVEGEKFSFPPLPEQILAIRDAGGLLPYVRKKLAEEKGG